MSSRRRSASTAEGRVEAALADIGAEWDATAAEVEEVEVGLEKSDITVRRLALVWVPVAR